MSSVTRRKTTSTVTSPRGDGALVFLAGAYSRNGHTRTPADREVNPGTHRGYEIRFSALNAAEREEIVKALRDAGFAPGRPFAKGPAWRIPVYGRDAVRRLRAVMRRVSRKG